MTASQPDAASSEVSPDPASPDTASPDVPPPGRPVLLEATPPGFWALILGGSIMVLAPLFGFLIGTAKGPGDGNTVLSPIYLALFIGVIVGGCGGLVALLGGARLYRSLHPPGSAAGGADASGGGTDPATTPAPEITD